MTMPPVCSARRSATALLPPAAGPGRVHYSSESEPSMMAKRDMVATLVAHDGIGQGVVDAAHAALVDAGLDVGRPSWIDPEEAVSFEFSGDRGAARAALEAADLPVDLFVMEAANRDCR